MLTALAVFMYMGFQIGAFRFDRSQYDLYSIYFSDTSGLSRKAAVRIAGVKVGWVESIELIPDTENKARVSVMIKNEFSLYLDSHAIVRQDGLLGPKYIEIVPGDPLLHRLDPGSVLQKPSVEPVSIDDIMLRFKEIAANVQEVTDSFKEVLGGPSGKENLQTIVTNISTTAEQFASFSDIMNRSLIRNEDNLDALLNIGTAVNRVANKLEGDVLPSFQESIEKISNVFDRDFDRIATHLSTTAESIDATASQAREGLRSISSVADKIDEGKGLLGKLVNEDETYTDLKMAIRGFKEYVARSERIEIIIDSHVETMLRQAEHLSLADSIRRFEDSKGYFDVKIHTSDDHFYVFQIVNSEKGSITRSETRKKFRDNSDNQSIDVDNLFLNPNGEFANNASLSASLNDFFVEQSTTIKRNSFKVGIQIGKIFHDIALRFGLIEGSAGFGVDIDIPFKTDKFRWVTTVEAYDFMGWNRIEDRRVHLKWLNKMYILNNIYFTFGADDFVSKQNSSVFLGLGLRFNDDDIKFLLPNMQGLTSMPVTNS